MSPNARRTLAACALALAMATVTAAPASASLRQPASAEPTFVAPVTEDYTGESWTVAFGHLVDQLQQQYAFTQWKAISWPRIRATYGPRIAEAQRHGARDVYVAALCALANELRDGHVNFQAADAGGAAVYSGLSARLFAGGFGMTATPLDDGTLMVSWVAPRGPAARAGIRPGARLLTWNARSSARAMDAVDLVMAPATPTDWRRHWEQARYLLRAPVGVRRAVTFLNPGARRAAGATLKAYDDHEESLARTDMRSYLSQHGTLPATIQTSTIDGNVGYIRVYGELDPWIFDPDDRRSTLSIFRDSVAAFSRAGAPAIIIDLRGNCGGEDAMVAGMMSSFYARRTFYEYASLYNLGTRLFEIWIEGADGFHSPGEGTWIEPGQSPYQGAVVALVDNGCISSGEGVALGISNLPKGSVVGFAGTNGSFGMVGGRANLPEGFTFGFPYGASLDADHRVQLDARYGRGGVVPDVRVPMTARNALRWAAGADPVLEAGVAEARRMAR